jgi:probable F420-dependent oxidoreductase
VQYWLNAGFVEFGELIPLARAAEQLGFSGIAMPDHLFFPKTIESAYPYSEDGSIAWPADTPWADPWVAISAMGAVTSDLRFSTGVQIAPLRDPFSLAKSIATANELTEGRIRVGFGVGWLREEFEVVGVDFESRGRRLDEMLVVLRLLWSGETVSYEGEFFSFESIQMRPAAHDVPIDIGGVSSPALRRAAEHDGWIVPHRSLEETAAMTLRLEEARRVAERPNREFHVGVTGPDLLREDVAALERLGVASMTMPIAGLGPSRTAEDRLQNLQDCARQLGIS